MPAKWLEWLKIAENGLNCWKWLDMAEYGCKQLEMAGHGWNWLERQEKCEKRLKIADNGLKWQKTAGMAGHGCKWLKMAGNGWRWLERLGNGWKWLEWQ